MRLSRRHLPPRKGTDMTITEAEVQLALQNWGDGLVKIAIANDEEGAEKAREIADGVIDELYAYATTSVLFKPTMASGEQTFRPTKAGALSYFAAQDPDFPLDGGFGLKGWRKVDSETSAIFIDGDTAMWMGWIICINADDEPTKVDKSFGYHKDSNGVLRIVQHHSSFPYTP